ncbi:MAG: CheR family methyltransferase, partial [Kofleriaceae bacterium]
MTPLVTRTLDEVARHTGLVFRDTRLTGAVEIIQAWLARHAIANPIEIGPGIAFDALLEQLVVHESYFDRDLEQLRLVDELVLARLVGTTEPIRLWSAGCANGEEPYTLAFMLASRGLLERATITATDLSAAAVTRARKGHYRPWSVRTTTDSPAMRYLVRAGTELHVPDSIKRAIRFEILNLVEDPFPANQQLIVCRNVLIYLDPPAIATVATKLANALAPDGWLFVAPSDARLDPFAPLVATVTDRGVYYRRGDAVAPIRALPPSLPPAIARVTAARLPPKPLPPPPPLSIAMRVRALADRGDHAAARKLLAQAIGAT